MKTVRPLLTIVIPVYNTDISLVRRAINSVPKIDKINILLIDDCSTSYDLYTELGNEYNIIRLSENKGLGYVRNYSIDNCSTKWIMFLDSDDEINTENIFKLFTEDISKLVNNRFSAIKGYIDLINDKCTVTDKVISESFIPYFTTPMIYEVKYLRENNIRYDESRRVYEDIPFSVKLWTSLNRDFYENKSYRISSTMTSLYKYYLQGQSLTRTDRDKYLLLSDTLQYWIDWIINYYKSMEDTGFKEFIRSNFINRIKYEATKSLELRLKYDYPDSDYNEYFDKLKTYKLNNLLNYQRYE